MPPTRGVSPPAAVAPSGTALISTFRPAVRGMQVPVSRGPASRDVFVTGAGVLGERRDFGMEMSVMGGGRRERRYSREGAIQGVMAVK